MSRVLLWKTTQVAYAINRIRQSLEFINAEISEKSKKEVITIKSYQLERPLEDELLSDNSRDVSFSLLMTNTQADSVYCIIENNMYVLGREGEALLAKIHDGGCKLRNTTLLEVTSAQVLGACVKFASVTMNGAPVGIIIQMMDATDAAFEDIRRKAFPYNDFPDLLPAKTDETVEKYFVQLANVAVHNFT